MKEKKRMRIFYKGRRRHRERKKGRKCRTSARGISWGSKEEGSVMKECLSCRDHRVFTCPRTHKKQAERNPEREEKKTQGKG